jgi:NADH-quinone oxidoreductase subunit J
MNTLLLLAADAEKTAECCAAMKYLECPSFWAVLLGVAGLLILVPRGVNSSSLRNVGVLCAVLSGATFALSAPPVPSSVMFWFLAFVTLGSGVAMISVHNPVYSALWFAASLVGTSGIFLMQGAQFLGVATIVVYAGAIVVTFLFVIMLAQPEGHAAYDRMSWSAFTKPAAIFSAALILGVLLGAMHNWFPSSKAESQERLGLYVKTTDEQLNKGGVLDKHHTAHLGRELFSKQLIAVEVAGTLLMAALVGAIAIAIHGKQQRPGLENAPEGVVS